MAIIIFILNIAITLYAFYFDQNLIGRFILKPYEVAKGRKLYTLITSGFIHKDWMHLIFNMISYYCFAFMLENTVGSIRFTIIYMFSLVLANIPTVVRHKNDYWYGSLGASGAISGVLFSYILFYPFNKMMILPIPFPIPAILFGVLYLGYCYYMSRRYQDGINHDAHLFGALAGIMLTVLLVPQVLTSFFASF